MWEAVQGQIRFSFRSAVWLAVQLVPFDDEARYQR
jgi:hypothetical protein